MAWTGACGRRLAMLVALGLCIPAATLAAQDVEPRAASEAAAPGQQRAALQRRALAVLAALHDGESGAWLGDVGYKLNLSWQVTAHNVPHVGATGLAVEALVASGQPLDDSPSGRLSRAGSISSFAPRFPRAPSGFISAHGSRMRSHAHGMRALAAVLRAELDAPVFEALDRATQFTIDARNPENGGWRHAPKSPTTDLIETAHQFEALRSSQRELWIAKSLAAAKPGSSSKPVDFGQEVKQGHAEVFEYAAALRIVDPERPMFGSYRFQDPATSRITGNTTAAGFAIFGP